MSEIVGRSLEILSGSDAWSATPDDYSSMRYLQFHKNMEGEAIYAYGQTIYAKDKFKYGVFEDNLALLFKESEEEINIKYELVPCNYEVVESVTGIKSAYSWLLRLSKFPFVSGKSYPHGQPLDYYGYREVENST